MCVVSIGLGWIVIVVSGEDQDVVIVQQRYQFWQMVVEQFQICGIIGDVVMVVLGRVEVNEVGEDDGVIIRFFYFFDGGVKQCVQVSCFYFFGDIVVGVDVCNFIDRNYLVVFFINQFLQYGWCWWFNSQVVMVIGMLEVIGFVVDKWMSDNMIDIVVVVGQFFMGDFVQFVEFIQIESFFMVGNLEYGVSGGIENWFVGFYVFFVQLIQNDCIGRVVVIEVIWQISVFDQFIQQFLWEVVFVIGEIFLFKQNWDIGNFLVIRWGIFIG